MSDDINTRKRTCFNGTAQIVNFKDNICVNNSASSISPDEPGKPLKVFVKFKVIDIDEIDGAHMVS